MLLEGLFEDFYRLHRLQKISFDPLQLNTWLGYKPFRPATRHANQAITGLAQALDQRPAQPFACPYHHGSHRLSPDVACMLNQACEQSVNELAIGQLYPDM
ncbi:hypothetical protein D3C79_572760 [compost metagenome]